MISCCHYSYKIQIFFLVSYLLSLGSMLLKVTVFTG